jgi:hypothetical protein
MSLTYNLPGSIFICPDTVPASILKLALIVLTIIILEEPKVKLVFLKLALKLITIFKLITSD